MGVYLWNTFCPTLFGTGASKEAGNKAKELGMHKVMVCTEHALCEFKVATQVIDVLKEAGLEQGRCAERYLRRRRGLCPRAWH